MYQAIDSNKQKSVLLIALVIGLVSAAGYAYGQATGDGWFGLVFALLFSVGGSLFTWFAGDTVALSTAGAKRVEQKEESPELWNIVENLSITAGIPMPKLYVIPDTAPNAFATGRDPEHASVAVTVGLIEKLSRPELEGVIAHELSHIQNYDTRWMVLVGVLVGSLSLLSNMFFRLGGSRRRGKDSGGGSLAIIGIVLLIISPIIGQLIRFAVSRKREYLADASGALLTRYPEGLASALEKISHDDDHVERAPEATAHLWISSPYEGGAKAASFFQKLFSTHPPIEDRIRILRSINR